MMRHLAVVVLVQLLCAVSARPNSIMKMASSHSGGAAGVVNAIGSGVKGIEKKMGERV